MCHRCIYCNNNKELNGFKDPCLQCIFHNFGKRESFHFFILRSLVMKSAISILCSYRSLLYWSMQNAIMLKLCMHNVIALDSYCMNCERASSYNLVLGINKVFTTQHFFIHVAFISSWGTIHKL